MAGLGPSWKCFPWCTCSLGLALWGEEVWQIIDGDCYDSAFGALSLLHQLVQAKEVGRLSQWVWLTSCVCPVIGPSPPHDPWVGYIPFPINLWNWLGWPCSIIAWRWTTSRHRSHLIIFFQLTSPIISSTSYRRDTWPTPPLSHPLGWLMHCHTIKWTWWPHWILVYL